MSEQTFNTRIILKHDIEAHWNLATGFIPRKGEIVIYDADESHAYPRFKIGDGSTTVGNLPFMGELTSDDEEASEPTPLDADTLGGHNADYFATKEAVGAAVLYTSQNLTEGQKAQARLNIGITGTSSDANVTKENVEAALGYTPADADDMTDAQDSIALLTPIISTTDITAGSAASGGRPYHVIE